MKNWIDSEVAAEDVVISSKVCLIRNFYNSLFTDKMKTEEARENVDRLYEILLDKIDEEMTLVRSWEHNIDFLKVYLEKHLISEGLVKRRDRSAFIINKDETLSIMINEEDNLRIQCITDGLDLTNAYNYVNKIDDYIEEVIGYAFDENFGYLTASPSNVGTGLKASVMVHLPALSISEEISNIFNGLNKVGMNIEGLYLESSKAWGNIYQISNQVTLGVRELEVIDNLEGIVNNIINEEKKFREVVDDKYKNELEDKIYRAYGVMKYAKLIKPKEVLDLLSYLRLGTEMGLLHIDKKVLNKLLIDTRTSMIQRSLPKGTDTMEQDIYRANIIKERLI
ncbi:MULTISPECIES: protein arginine kinase [Clostridium]|uniref:Protein-arginine kinase n=1 Tax=Clostridium cibarium TaxID=2762247 RepID=A0ABR8PWZ1_9CLOT|nr:MULTISPECIES: protein arginine kinase [Clostridium]MBD7912676.1 protein arginine kinase [Clostridium cibarium]